MFEVSVIIPVYNAAEFLEKAVHSALYFDEVKEIILAEDCSTDHSLQLCEQLASQYSRIKLYQHPDKGNHGAGATRNLGLSKVQSAFIAFLDSDDYYLPNRFNAEKELFKDHKTDGVFGAIGVDYLSEKGKEEYQKKFSSELTTVQYKAEGKEVYEGLLGLTERSFGTFFHLNALTVKREALEKHQLCFNENLRVHQDSDFIIKLAFHAYLKAGIIDTAIAMRGVHDDNRITKIKRYTRNYNERQFLLWNSLYQWSENQNIGSRAKEYLFLQHKAFQLSLYSPVMKMIRLIPVIFIHPQILKTKYRFTFSHQHEA